MPAMIYNFPQGELIQKAVAPELTESNTLTALITHQGALVYVWGRRATIYKRLNSPTGMFVEVDTYAPDALDNRRTVGIRREAVDIVGSERPLDELKKDLAEAARITRELMGENEPPADTGKLN